MLSRQNVSLEGDLGFPLIGLDSLEQVISLPGTSVCGGNETHLLCRNHVLFVPFVASK